MQVFIDLDYTLLDTDKFKKALEDNVANIDYKDLLYPDALEFLSYAGKYGIPTLFSEGEVDFQKQKVQKTGLEKIFGQNIKIYPSYKKVFDLQNMAIDKQSVLVDDKPDVIDSAISVGMKAIRVRRGKYKDIQLSQDPFAEVASLEEIIRKDLLFGL